MYKENILYADTYTHTHTHTHTQLLSHKEKLWKTLVPSYYCLYSLYNKIRNKGKVVSAGYWGGGEGGGGGRGEKWTKPCMHIWIIKEKW
jgi:hypothetical protein